MNWLAIFAGGGIGAALRYAMTIFVDHRVAAPFPWGTFAVNAVGCLAIGFLATWSDARGGVSAPLRLFVVTGVLGGFTTFSTFGLETWRLLEEGRALVALAYSLGSVTAALTGVALGVLLGRNLG